MRLAEEKLFLTKKSYGSTGKEVAPGVSYEIRQSLGRLAKVLQEKIKKLEKEQNSRYPDQKTIARLMAKISELKNTLDNAALVHGMPTHVR